MELKIRIKKEGKEFIARAEDYKVTAIGKTKGSKSKFEE